MATIAWVGGSEDVYLRFQTCREGRASAIGGLARDGEPMARESVPDSFPSVSPIGIGLIEHGDPSSPHTDEVIDQSLRLLAIGGPQVEHRIEVGRLPLRLGPREWKEE